MASIELFALLDGMNYDINTIKGNDRSNGRRPDASKEYVIEI